MPILGKKLPISKISPNINSKYLQRYEKENSTIQRKEIYQSGICNRMQILENSGGNMLGNILHVMWQ